MSSILPSVRKKVKFIGKYRRVFGHTAGVKLDAGTICRLYRYKDDSHISKDSALLMYQGVFVMTVTYPSFWVKI